MRRLKYLLGVISISIFFVGCEVVNEEDNSTSPLIETAPQVQIDTLAETDVIEINSSVSNELSTDTDTDTDTTTTTQPITTPSSIVVTDNTTHTLVTPRANISKRCSKIRR